MDAKNRHRRSKAAVNNLSSSLNNNFSYTIVTSPVELAVVESSFTSHFLSATCSCNNQVALVHLGQLVSIHNGETMVAMHRAQLPFPQIPIAARKCDVFPALQQPLLSLGQLYDAVFMTTFNSETVILTKDGRSTLSGTRYHNNGLYFIPL